MIKPVFLALLASACGADEVSIPTNETLSNHGFLKLPRNSSGRGRQRPIVQSAGDIVTLGQPTNGDGSNYLGSVRIGSQHDRVTTFYDTKNKKTAIVVNGASRSGYILDSNYVLGGSSTLKRMYKANSSQAQEDALTGTVSFLDTQLSGKVYREQMCLIENEYATKIGNLCVKNQQFIGVDKIAGKFETNGIVGLGPQQSDDDFSIVHQLYDQSMISGLRVGINFEDPFDSSLESTISFGYFEQSHFKGEEDDLNWFVNKAQDSWAIEIISFSYDGIELSPVPGQRRAHIDTAGLNVKLPKAEFKRVFDVLKQQDDTVYQYDDADALGKLIASKKTCNELAKIVSDIQLCLPGTVLQLRPHAYLWSYSGDDGCNLGFEETTSEDYYLGTLFLRNFYVGLDYEFNSILIGKNNQAVDVAIHGSSPNPFKKGPSAALVFVIIFLIILILVGVFCYVRAKKIDEEQRTIIFGREVVKSDSQMRRYKNGVEIKPSEYTAEEKKKLRKATDQKKKTGAINESRANDSDEGEVFSDAEDDEEETQETLTKHIVPDDEIFEQDESDQMKEKLLDQEE